MLRAESFVLAFVLCAPVVSAATRPLPLIVLEGSPRERGLTHGKTLRSQIQAGIAEWKAGLRETYKMDADVFIEAFVAKTDYPAAIRKWTPGLLEEVEGIAEGAGVDFRTMLAFQLLDESWNNGDWVAANHCSALGFGRRGTGMPLVAQNMDLEGFRDGYQAILHVKEPSGVESLVFTQAGLVALNGVNNRGVGVVVNTLTQLNHAREGLPVAFVVRGILSQSTRQEAVELLERVPHASGQNYIVGGRDGVSELEAAAGKVVTVEAPGENETVYHTNHPLVNDHYNEKYRRALERMDKLDPAAMDRDNSHTRYQSLEARLKGVIGSDPIAAVEAVLRAKDSELHPVCRRNAGKSGMFTFGSTIMVLSDEPEIRVTAGPPDESTYERFRFLREETISNARPQ